MPQRYRILAVDDDDDTLNLIRMTLAEDYDVLTLRSPLQVYDCIELFEPDLLMLDIMMPKITGYQLIEMLKKHSKTQHLPIIILSAKDNVREIKHGYKLGASLYLTKPFEPERLLKNTETQFRMHPPEGRPKLLSMDQVQIQLEVKFGRLQDQVVLSSDLLSPKNIKGGDLPRSRKGATRKPKEEPPPESGSPSWEG